MFFTVYINDFEYVFGDQTAFSKMANGIEKITQPLDICNMMCEFQIWHFQSKQNRQVILRTVCSYLILLRWSMYARIICEEPTQPFWTGKLIASRSMMM